MLEIYSDGGSRGNPGISAWAYAVYIDGSYKGQKSKGYPNATNNQMELEALIQALEWYTKYIDIAPTCTVYTDSSYVQQGFSNWLGNWKRRGWRTASGTEVKNKDQWEKVWKLKQLLQSKVTVEKVKGHSGNIGNDKADYLVNLCQDEIAKGDK